MMSRRMGEASFRVLYRFCAEQTLTINTTAAGGNVALLAQAAAPAANR